MLNRPYSPQSFTFIYGYVIFISLVLFILLLLRKLVVVARHTSKVHINIKHIIIASPVRYCAESRDHISTAAHDASQSEATERVLGEATHGMMVCKRGPFHRNSSVSSFVSTLTGTRLAKHAKRKGEIRSTLLVATTSSKLVGWISHRIKTSIHTHLHTLYRDIHI